MNKQNKIKFLGVFFLLLFLVSLPANFNFIDLNNNVNGDLETSDLNCLYKGKEYDITLDDFYDDADVDHLYTGANFSYYDYNNDVSYEEVVSVVNNSESIHPFDTNVDMTTGTFDDTDNMHEDDGSYSVFTAGGTAGVYSGTDSFEDITAGDPPADGWHYIPNAGQSWSVLESYDGHHKVLKYVDTSNAMYGNCYYTFDIQTDMILEFWMQSSSVGLSYSPLFNMQEDTSGRVQVAWNTNDLMYHDGVWRTMASNIFLANTWHHFKYIFDDTTNTFDCYVDEVLRGDDRGYRFNTVTGLTRINFGSGTNDVANTYYDAIGIVGLNGYEEGDNLVEEPIKIDACISSPEFDRYDTEDLLALNIISSHYTSIATAVSMNLWNYDTTSWDNLGSSTKTSEFKNEFSITANIEDYFSPSGKVLFSYNTSDASAHTLTSDYIEFLLVYKLDLTHAISFPSVGIWQYQWEVYGTIHYTDWVLFEVIEPPPNFFAMSDSDYITRWRMQGNEIAPTEDFTDDISPSDTWDLNDVSQDYFLTYLPDISNYLLDDYSFHDSLYMSPTQFTDFSYTKGDDNSAGELETNNNVNYAIIDAGYTLSGESLLGTMLPDGDIITNWADADAPAHWSKLNEGLGSEPDGGNIREASHGVDDRWNFDDTLTISANHVVTRVIVYVYIKHGLTDDPRTGMYMSSNVGVNGYFAGGNNVYCWESDSTSGLELSQTQLNGLYINVEPCLLGFGQDLTWIDIEAVYVNVYESLKQYSFDYTITWDVASPESIDEFHYDYRTTASVDCDLDIYDWDDDDWDEELQSNTGTGFITDSYVLTDPYISGSDQIRIRFQSASSNSDFDMELDQIAFEYNSRYSISKKHDDTIPDYAYMQTNTTELISLESTVYGSTTTLNGTNSDYLEVFFQTSSDSEISLILMSSGEVFETLILSGSGNTNFNDRTVQLSPENGEFWEFDQLIFSSTFEDTDYFRLYDIKTYNYIIVGDSYDFYVSSHNQREIYIIPDTYNLRIYDPYDAEIKANVNLTITASDYYYIYEPAETIECRLTLFNTRKENHLDFEDYHITINRSLNGEWNSYNLLDNLFTADEGTLVYINIYDTFDTLIDSFDKVASSYIDLELDVYSLQIKNLMDQKTTIDINATYTYPLLSGDSIYFMLSKEYYQIGYYDSNDNYKQFTIYLNSNQAYELNRSRICFLSYADQQGTHLTFDNYKTYLNGSLIYENIFYEEIGEDINITIKDRYDIQIHSEIYTVVSTDNYIPITLTMYSLKIYSQQLVFNHINISRNPAYYQSSMYWSEWIAPSEIIDFRLFSGYYTINITNAEDSSYSLYDYTLNGDDVILISSDNTLYNVLYNIANVNTTIGNQITTVQIDLTNQNSDINNSIVNIVINLDSINSSLGTMLVDIDTTISNIETSIISEIVSIGVDIDNVNTSLSNQMLTITTDISNLDTSITSQFVSLGVDISNINGSIISQIIDLGVDVSNFNTSLSNQMLSIGVDISNLDTSITNQITSVISNINNINTTLSTQITSLSSDIININSSIVNQIVSLGVDITNIDTSLSNQIVSLGVDITNINASIIEQILMVIADIENIETVIDDQTLVILADITNLNSTLLNQMVSLGVDITNINASIINQILSLSVDITTINSTITNMLTDIGLSITNMDSDIGTFFTFTNNSFINLNTNMNNSFIYIENNIISINQTISTLVIGIDNRITILNGTITTMFTEMSNQFIVTQTTIDYSFAFLNQTIIQLANEIGDNQIVLYNLIEQRANDIDNSLIEISTLVNLINSSVVNESLVIQALVNIIGNNITENHVIINDLINLIGNNITENNINMVNLVELVGNNITTNHFVIQTLIDYVSNNITDNHLELITNLNLINNTIDQNQIELINRLLFINNSINEMVLDLTNQILLVNNTIYSAILDVSTSIDFNSDNILGNISLTYQQNDFLTELYQTTMFSQLLNWSDVAYNYTLMEDRIDAWEFINNYRNDSITVFLKYGDLIDNLTITAQNTLSQYLPSSNVEYRLWSVEQEEYISEWEALPENKTVNFGFFEEDVPIDPSPIIAGYETMFWFVVFFAIALINAIVLYVRLQKKRGKSYKKYVPQKKKKKGTFNDSLVGD
ncbi:MAG: hypothetical protein ACTSSB_11330 [Candidatus Heimdallarchaeota archaeon]